MSTTDAEHAPAGTSAPEGEGMTRRQMLAAAAGGGVALAATALGSAKVGSLVTSAQYDLELNKLRTLLAMYEQLEKVGLDAVLTTGMNVMRAPFDAVKGGLRLVQDGITAVENAIQSFRTSLDNLRGATEAARGLLADLANRYHAAESLIDGVLGKAQPLAQSIGGFFTALLSKIPFGIGDNIKNAIDALVKLIQDIPTTIDALTAQLLKPLADTFFPPSGTATVQTGLLDPISEKLLQPLKSFLANVESLVDHWENDFSTPVQSALAQRAQLRQEIDDYRRQNKL